MKTITINANNIKLNDKLERAYQDLLARQSIITYMMNSTSFNNIDSDNYKKYHQEYVEKFIDYDKIRNEVGDYYDLKKYGNNAYWNIDFSTKTITVTINNNNADNSDV